MIPNSSAKIIIHAPICRMTWGRLYYFLRSGDPQGSGQVTISRHELLDFFEVDNSTLYRWLQDGRKDGAFRNYSRLGDTFSIWLGSKSAITLALGLPDWGAATVIDRAALAAPEWRGRVTAHQTYWQQRRSKTAALNTARMERRKKPQVARIKFNLRRATAKPTLQFIRNKIPFGCNQIGIGKTLNISERTVRRHLKPVSRVQQAHKIPYPQGWAHIMIAKETGKKPLCFIRGNEAFKFGCNIYDLAFEQRSEQTQRLKHLFFLCKIARRRGIDSDNPDLSLLGLWDRSFAGCLCMNDFMKVRSFDSFRKTLLASLHLRRKA
jgi:hypothetical protein